MNNMKIKISDFKLKYSQLLSESKGLDISYVNGVCSAHQAQSEHIMFSSTLTLLKCAMNSKHSVVVTNENFKSSISENEYTDKLFFFTKQLDVLLAYFLRDFILPHTTTHLNTPFSANQYFLHPSAQIGDNVIIYPGSYIGAHAKIDHNTTIGPNCSLFEHSQIGQHTKLMGHVVIHSNCQIGNHCIIHSNTTIGSDGFSYTSDLDKKPLKIPQIGRVVIEDFVEIGANCAIDRAAFDETRVGEHTKIDNLCHIAHNCKIGKNCLITAGFFVAGSTQLEDNIIIGGKVTITDHIKVCSNVQLAGLAVVSKSIKQPGAYGGYPLQPLKKFLKTTATLVHLPKMRKSILEIINKIQST